MTAAKQLSKAGLDMDEQYCSKDRKVQLQTEFKSNLAQMDSNPEPYEEFFYEKLEHTIRTGYNSQRGLDYTDLIRLGDYYLSFQFNRICLETIGTDSSFRYRKNALVLLYHFTIWGDAEAIILINHDASIAAICKAIGQVDGHSGLKAGRNIYL